MSGCVKTHNDGIEYSNSHSNSHSNYHSNTTYWIPYFISATYAEGKPDGAGKDWNVLAILGLALHIGTWITVVVLDACFLLWNFNGESESNLHLLQIASFTALAIAAGTVVVCGGLHSRRLWNIDFNQNLLPPFATSMIVANIRASLEFSKFLLFYVIFEPGRVVTVQGADAVAYKVKAILIAVVVLKYFGVSMTMNQQRRRVSDVTHQPVL